MLAAVQPPAPEIIPLEPITRLGSKLLCVPAPAKSVRNRDCARQLCTRRKPMFVTLEFDPDPFVVHAQVTVTVTNDRLRHHLLHFLRDDADIGTIAAVVAKAIIAKTVGETPEQDDVVFDGDIGSPSAAATTTATTTAAATAEATATTTVEGSTTAAAEAATVEAAASDVRAVAHSTVPRVS